MPLRNYHDDPVEDDAGPHDEEEDGDLEERDQEVGEVAGGLHHPVVYVPHALDEGDVGLPVEETLPPAERGEEEAEGDGPRELHGPGAVAHVVHDGPDQGAAQLDQDGHDVDAHLDLTISVAIRSER